MCFRLVEAMSNAKHEQLDPTSYSTSETFSLLLEPSHSFCGMTYLPLPRNVLALIYFHNNQHILELRQIDNDHLTIIRSIELTDLPSSIDDFIWCEQRNEFLIISNGQLFGYNLDEEKLTKHFILDTGENKYRLACNSKFIACVDSRTLKFFDIETWKIVREKRLDHVCEDIEYDDRYFLSTHTGKLEFLDRTLLSIRRYPIGGTAICRFNSKYWLIADAFDDRLLWQSLDKLLLTIHHIHQPKSLVVIPNISRIVIQCTNPNRMLIYDPIQ